MTTLPASSGISLKPQHYRQILQQLPAVGWFEVHPENYMGDGGLPHHYLEQITQHYPLSMHGVGLSLGSADGVDPHHLSALKAVVDRHQPHQVSEHLAWSQTGGTFFNDLLPIPYNEAFLQIVTANVAQVQQELQRNLLIENPSLYLPVSQGQLPNSLTETEFLTHLLDATGAGLLLDINNVYVSSQNLQFDPFDYIDQLPLDRVGEIHLAGHSQDAHSDLLIDNHGAAVADPVWELYSYALERCHGPLPTLIEWDTHVPTLEVLIGEAEKASALLSTRNSAAKPSASVV